MGRPRLQPNKEAAMFQYTAAGPAYTTKNPLAESLIVCLLSLLVLIIGC
jgi:hypothetical protein